MPATYDCIKSSILGSSASVVTFDNISANYTDLILIVNAASDTTNAFQYIQFNGDTGSNYSYTQMYGNGTTSYTSRSTSSTQLFNSDVSMKQTTLAYNGVFHIMNYSNTSTFKTALSQQHCADSADYIAALSAVGLWRNTNAITSIEIKATRGGTAYNFSANSTFALYGIKAA